MADYVDNETLTKEIGDWARRVREQISKGEKPDKMTDYIAESVFMICNNMSYKSSFINYTYRDEMIGDAIENCILYLKNFDNEKNDNAFGYISTIVYYAFVRRIKKENRRHIEHLQYIKKVFTEDGLAEQLSADDPNDVKGYQSYIDHMQSILDDMSIEEPEVHERKKREKVNNSLDDILTGKEY